MKTINEMPDNDQDYYQNSFAESDYDENRGNDYVNDGLADDELNDNEDDSYSTSTSNDYDLDDEDYDDDDDDDTDANDDDVVDSADSNSKNPVYIKDMPPIDGARPGVI